MSRFVSSQTISLMEPSPNPNPPARGGGDTAIVGNALLVNAGPLGAATDITSTPLSDQISLYVVRNGDTLSQIAQMFGVSVNTIVWANDLPRSAKVSKGQTLVILPVSGIQHTVLKGDTVQKIAKRYGADSEEIAQFNGIDENHPLIAGQIILVPDGESAPAPGRIAQKPRGTSKREVSSGYYIKPVAKAIKTQGIHGYNGVDLAAPLGTPIVAAADGQVIVSRSEGWNGGYGKYIVIKHNNGAQTLYAHNKENAVSQGDWVKQGDVIGAVGNTGRSTGYHVHFEVRGAKNPF
ncbi:MAG TPA: hypothetical protein DCZ84_01310 [Candidatus Vogelbacteria bacterium]|uniref:LysM domain-containing protein n=1 Tax=Candidatus Vogelbacteria bacterium RIFOXYD1_FULL_51_18 TaxID=1802440 RepID=A0A1G2QK55_9BACT|nr:MAG: lipoprotein precursor [Parcubacteria group bacterium GW2011_GWC1_51_35]KKW25251.1 MAG: Lipoprotein [Parcubacteria group bacterium GW2011_GWF2_52_12]KKW28066.1 MAG: Lipoprotein [Parcubacteria group bacterium GW2011_GWF1_52_5]OHA60459.1 MAG: hypothetical protein A2569_01330 [Candidatus Vogelbacteria bacterium RIFOXYD1_FULL_51_18]HBB65259.1 hypothetical protein [Candidatus Vogelbacteria bacterium]